MQARIRGWSNNLYQLEMIAVQAQHSNVLHCYVQGNLEDRQGKTIIMTVHDVGTNREFLFCTQIESLL